MKHLLMAVTLVLLAGLVGPTVDAVDCPEEFTICVNVQNKACKVGTQCTTTDLGVQSCTRPNGGGTFGCQTGQTVGVKNCPCITKLENQCCSEETCSCGSCEEQPGRQQLVCLGIACTNPCQTHYCTGEGVGCQWNGTCGAGSCCNYTCNVPISECHGVDPCPSGACSC